MLRRAFHLAGAAGDIMRVTRNDISKQFDALIDGTRTREDVEKWAEGRR